MDSLESLFERFLTERRYLKNITTRTEYSYNNAKNALFRLYGADMPLDALSKEKLSSWVVCMRQKGLSAVSCNVYIRTVNAFLHWLRDEGLAKDPPRVALLRTEQKVITTFSAEQVRTFLECRPRTLTEARIHALVCTLLDTGLRIEEALQVKRMDADLENLLLTVHGKGNKQRKVPMSFELRKILWKHTKKQAKASGLLFGTRDGTRLSQRNVLRDLKLLAKRLGITGVRVSPHTMRHTFAVTYLRAGGNVFYLQRILGHATLEMTMRYVRSLGIEDLQEVHNGLSPLCR